MKRILLLLAIVAIGLVSCKKEEEVKPSAVKNQKVMTGEKQDMGGWD